MTERTYTVTWRRPDGEEMTCANLSPRIAFARLWAAWKGAGEITVVDVQSDWLTQDTYVTKNWPYPLPMPKCQDNRGDEHWTCIMYDGTGLWCDACTEWQEDNAAVLETILNQ